MADTEDINDTSPGAATSQFGGSKEMCQHLIDLFRQGGDATFYAYRLVAT